MCSCLFSTCGRFCLFRNLTVTCSSSSAAIMIISHVLLVPDLKIVFTSRTRMKHSPGWSQDCFMFTTSICWFACLCIRTYHVLTRYIVHCSHATLLSSTWWLLWILVELLWVVKHGYDFKVPRCGGNVDMTVWQRAEVGMKCYGDYLLLLLNQSPILIGMLSTFPQSSPFLCW